MPVAKRLLDHLQTQGVDYQLVRHSHSGSSMETAEQAHVPGDALAKGVVVRDGGGFLLVVIPSDYHVELEKVRRMLGREVAMATESELGELFDDCEVGAVPPIGPAFGLRTIWDPNTSLGSAEMVFFESGDHEHLLQVSGRAFHELMGPAERGRFSHHI